MSRCQHNQKITKFCVTPSCNHYTSGGCEYCFKRYHCHLGQSKFVKQTQICDIIKYLTSFEDKKPKIRPLKQSIYNYFNIIKGQLSTYLDCLSSDLLNKLTYSYMIKQECFNVFKKLKQKQYNKLSASDVIHLIQFKDQNDSKKLQKHQLHDYIVSTQQVYNKINKINNLYKQFKKETSDSYLGEPIMSVSILYKKITEIYDFIKNEKISKEEHFKKNLQSKKDEISQKNIVNNLKEVKRLTKVYSEKNNQSNSNSDEKIKQFIQNKFKAEDDKKISEIITSQIEKASILRPRKFSIESQCHDLVGKSKLKTFQEKQKQILERKKRLDEIMYLSQKKKQPDNVQSSSGTSSQQVKNQQGYYSENQNIFEKANKNNQSNDENMIAYKLLPAGIEQKRLYEQKQSVEKKTLKIAVNVIPQNAEDEQCQSPILRLKKSEKPKTNTSSSGFQIGLFKVRETPTKSQPHSGPVLPQVQFKSDQLSSGSDKQNIQPPENEKHTNLQISENQTTSLYLLIESLKVSGKKAIPLLQSALKYAPNNFSAIQYLTFLLLEQNLPKQCLKVCNEALKIIAGQPNGIEISFHLFNNKAAALNMLGRFSESIQILERCLQVSKKDILYKNLGDAYFSLGIIEKAVINYENTLILNDENHEALFNLAVCLYTQKNFDSAKLKVQRALMLDQNNDNYIELFKQIGYALKSA